MKTLLIIGTFEALFLILLILGKREKRHSDIYLGFIFFSLALSIGFTWLEIFNADNGYPFPWALNVSWIFIFLHGPALWLYIKSLSISGFSFRPVYLLHFIPFAGFFIVQYFSFFTLEPSHRIQLVINNTFQEWLFYKISVIGIGISTFTYLIWGLKQIGDRRQRLKYHFSRIDNKDLEWLRILIIVSLVVYAGNVGLFLLDLVLDVAPYKVLMLAAYSFASVYILVLGFFGLQQGNVFLNNVIEPRKVRIKNVGPESRENKGNWELIPSLTTFMEEKKPYLEPEITLSKLSAMIQVTPETLSEVLNQHLHHPFFDYINQYRVEEFKLECLSKENAHLSIMGIAYNCGFNSKAAFYRAFRKYEKISPGEYMQRLRKK